MKMPNFRLSETQASVAVLSGIIGLGSLLLQSIVTLKNFHRQTWTILYSETSTWGPYRQPLVFFFTAVTVLLGATALSMGFHSLGQKRNTKQGRSFLGMAIGGVAIAIAPVLLMLWLQRAEPIIQKAQ